jgi:hypothetical protein
LTKRSGPNRRGDLETLFLPLMRTAERQQHSTDHRGKSYTLCPVTPSPPSGHEDTHKK